MSIVYFKKMYPYISDVAPGYYFNGAELNSHNLYITGDSGDRNMLLHRLYVVWVFNLTVDNHEKSLINRVYI
jgi:hypothetical protein